MFDFGGESTDTLTMSSDSETEQPNTLATTTVPPKKIILPGKISGKPINPMSVSHTPHKRSSDQAQMDDRLANELKKHKNVDFTPQQLKIISSMMGSTPSDSKTKMLSFQLLDFLILQFHLIKSGPSVLLKV